MPQSVHLLHPGDRLSVDEAKLEHVIDNFVERAPVNLSIDIANGYLQSSSEFVARTRDRHPGQRILTGNVVTAEMADPSLLHGADIVKIGIVPGSVCTARKAAGVSYSQLSAIIGHAEAAHDLDALNCDEVGIQVAGSLCNSYGSGSDFLMIGGLLANHDERGGDVGERWFEEGNLSKDTSRKLEKQRVTSFYSIQFGEGNGAL